MKKAISIGVFIIIIILIYLCKKSSLVTLDGNESDPIHTLDASCSKLYDEYYHKTYAQKDFAQKPNVEKKYALTDECMQQEKQIYLIKKGDYSEKEIDIFESEGSYFEYIDQEVTLKFSDNSEVKLNEKNPILKTSEKSIKNLSSIDGDILFLSNTKKIDDNENGYEYSEIQ